MKNLFLAVSLSAVAWSLMSCGSSSVTPGAAGDGGTALSGIWSGPLKFNGGQTYTVYVDFDTNASNVMVWQEEAGYIKQRGAVASASVSNRAVTVTWNDTLYSCAADTTVGKINATLNAAGTIITGNFDFGSVVNNGTVSLTPTTSLPTPIKDCTQK